MKSIVFKLKKYICIYKAICPPKYLCKIYFISIVMAKARTVYDDVVVVEHIRNEYIVGRQQDPLLDLDHEVERKQIRVVHRQRIFAQNEEMDEVHNFLEIDY